MKNSIGKWMTNHPLFFTIVILLVATCCGAVCGNMPRIGLMLVNRIGAVINQQYLRL